MEQVPVQWFATLGVGGIVAAFMFMFYRKDVANYTKLWNEQASQNRAVLESVLGVVKENTVALTKVVTIVDSFHRRIDSNGPPYPQRDERKNH